MTGKIIIFILSTFALNSILAQDGEFAGAIRNNDGTDVKLRRKHQGKFKAYILKELEQAFTDQNVPKDGFYYKMWHKYYSAQTYETVSQVWYNRFMDQADDRFLNCPFCGVFSHVGVLAAYGCWCTFSDTAKLLNHGGQVQDDADSICRDLQLCYRCAEIDNDPNSPSCDPLTVQFDLEVVSGNLVCSDPDSTCARRTCDCSAAFIFNSMGASISNQFMHDNPTGANFDFNGECKTPSNPVTPTGSSPGATIGDQQCCGPSEYRKPYHPGGGLNDCCQDAVVFNLIEQTCCSDGSLVNSAGGAVCP